MERNNNFVVTETDQSKQKCTAVLMNFLQHARKLAIGQYITSTIFEMKCDKIGHSRWMLIVFPAGQYEFGQDSGQLSVYLKMMACEHEHEKLLVDVKFFIESEERFSKIVPASTFQYLNKSTRWVGTNLASKLTFQSHHSNNGDNLMRDNDLVIGCRMIHSTLANDAANDVEWKQKQMMTLERNESNAVGIDSPVPPPPPSNISSSTIVQSQATGTGSTLPSTLISGSSSNRQRLKHSKMRRIFCC